MDDRLVAELAAMVAVDQGVGAARAAGVFAHRVTLEERSELQRVRVTNTDRLRAIVAEFEWPGRMLVGEQGAEDAWLLLAQHADHQLDSQRIFLQALQAAVDAGDAPARHAAYLADRVAMNEGRPQTYGTQIAEVTNGEGVPWPIRAPHSSTSDARASGYHRSRSTSRSGAGCDKPFPPLIAFRREREAPRSSSLSTATVAASPVGHPRSRGVGRTRLRVALPRFAPDAS